MSVVLVTRDLQEKAGEISLALTWGFTDLAEAVAWADFIIEQSDNISDEIVSVSLSKSIPDAISQLSKLAKGCDKWNVLRLFLQRFSNLDSIPYAQASKLGKNLYHFCIINEPAPKEMECLYFHHDSVQLALDGVYGEPNVAVRELLDDIRKVVSF